MLTSNKEEASINPIFNIAGSYDDMVPPGRMVPLPYYVSNSIILYFVFCSSAYSLCIDIYCLEHQHDNKTH